MSGSVLRRLQATVIALIAASTPAWPQANQPDAEELDTVEVTGSRIARPAADRLQPGLVIDNKTIEQRGHTNIVDALNDVPAFGPAASSSSGLQPSSFAIAQSYADFLSLGSQRTLTLVNGRRFVSSNTPSNFSPVNAGQQVDLNSIPTKLIERVDILTAGGAPIYGSDAISGTVNLILKRDYEGAEIDVLGGQTDRGDVDTYRVRALTGMNFAADRGNVTLNAEYLKTGGLSYLDRARTAGGLAYATPSNPNSPYVNELIDNRRVPIFGANGVPMLVDAVPQFAGVRNANGQVMQFGPGGTLIPFQFGTPTGSLAAASGGDGYDPAYESNLLASTERTNVTLLGSLQLSPSVRAFGEGWYSSTRGTRLAGSSIYNTLAFGPAGAPDGNLRISIDNPFLPAASRALILGNLTAAGLDTRYFYLTRASTDLQNGSARSETRLYRGVAGIEGDFRLNDKPFHWEASVTYGESETNSREPQVVQRNFLNALDAVIDPATGRIECAGTVSGNLVSAPIDTGSSTCAPLNLFGAGSPSSAAINYITTQARTKSLVNQRVVTGSVSGDLITLPSGEVRAVLGAESRREASSFEPDRFYAEGLGRAVAVRGLRGKLQTHELFTELFVPIFGAQQGIPFVKSLHVEGAARYVDHSVAGDDVTWTAGASYFPISAIQIRGNKTVAIRSPAITESFLPTTNAFATARDPCDSRYIGAGPDPVVRASNCAAAGITQPFQSFIVDVASRVSVAGNANLRNEQADSHTLGIVLRPRWTPGLSLSIDWVRIELKDPIVLLNAEGMLRSCFDSTGGIHETAQCANIDRNSGGQVTFVRTGYTNAGSTNLNAVMAHLDYARELGPGRLNASADVFKLRSLSTRVGLGDANQSAGEVGTSRTQGALTLGYQLRELSLSLRTTYMGPARWDVDEPVTARDYSKLSDWWVWDLSAGYSVGQNLTVRAFIENILDRQAPYPVPADGGITTYFDGLLGRSYALSLNYRF